MTYIKPRLNSIEAQRVQASAMTGVLPPNYHVPCDGALGTDGVIIMYRDEHGDTQIEVVPDAVIAAVLTAAGL